MRTSTALTLSILLAFALFPTHAAENHLIGTWVGTVDEESQSELTVRHVGERKIASGYYCIRTPGRHGVNDFDADGSRAGAVQARATKTRLTTTIRNFRLTAKVNRDRDTIQFRAKSQKRKVHRPMYATEAINAPCRPRIVPLTVDGVPDDDRPVGQTFADLLAVARTAPDAHPLVGSWTGQRASGLTIELNITSVTDGLVQGLYCNTWASGWRATDMDRDIPGGIDASATDTTLTFERNDRHFNFTLDGPQAMTYGQTIPKRGSQTLAIVRTDDPTCASRVIVPTK